MGLLAISYAHRVFNNFTYVIDSNEKNEDLLVYGTRNNFVIDANLTKQQERVWADVNAVSHNSPSLVKELVNTFLLSSMSKDSPSNSFKALVNQQENYSKNDMDNLMNLHSELLHRGSGNINNLYGYKNYILIDKKNGEANTSTIKNLFGIHSHVNFFDNHNQKIENLYGIYVNHFSSLNNTEKLDINTHYGLYIDNIKGAKVPTGGTEKDANNYAIYTKTGKVRFGDNVGVGVDIPNEKLEVNGAIKVSNTANTCSDTNRGTIKFENDNFYGCKSTGWVLLNN